MGINKFIYVVTYVVHKAPKNHVKQNAKQKHLGCKKVQGQEEAAFVNESVTKSSDIR